MTQHAIPLGRIAGIRIQLDYSWFLIVGLLTWMLATNYYPSELRAGSLAESWILGGVTALLFFGSVLLHELGHSLVARHYHIRVRSITLFIFGGVSDIATEPPSAASEFWISIAGPVTSLALAACFALSQPLFGPLSPLAAVAKYLSLINGMLGIFNLVPGFPLDGGRVFRAIIRGFTHNLQQATLIAGNVGRVIAYLFIGLGVWQVFNGNVLNGVWIAFIGWFLESAATSQIHRQTLHGLLAGHAVSEAMTREFVDIPATTTLRSLVDEHVFGKGRRSFVVKTGSNVIGLLTLHQIKETDQSQWSKTTAGHAMIPLSDTKRVAPDAELWTALQVMDGDGVNQLPVMANGLIVGMLTREGIIAFLRTMKELGM